MEETQKIRMINYNKHINNFSVERTINKFILLHPHVQIDVEGFYQFLNDFKLDCCSPILSLSTRIANTKKYKEVFGRLMDSYCSNDIQYSGIKFLDKMVDNYRMNPGDAELNSAIITVLRIPNWPMLSDDELSNLNKNRSVEELGVLDTTTCPYQLTDNDKVIPLDLIQAIDKFYDRVSDYIENNFDDQPKHLKGPDGKKILFSKNDLKEAIRKFRRMVDGTERITPGLEKVITYYRKLKNSDLVKIFDKNDEGFTKDSFMETESGCQMNSYRSILIKLNELASIARVSNTIGNYFCGNSKYVNQKMKKIIPFLFDKSGLNIPMDCADFSYGKGDAYKTRIVYVLWTVIQNILGPTADRWGKLQEKFGYDLIGTTHQHELLNKEGKECDDAVGIDYTQYSDYLFKGVFFEILKTIGFSDKKARIICELVSLPIIFKGKLYPILLSSTMGVKMDFVLITEANLYMYAISSIILNKSSDDINVVGDDRWETVKGRKFSAKEIYTKLQVACSFNCKVNPEKTSWLSRDGIFGGCHVWYNSFKLPSTGIAPSQLLKDFYQINDFNALINKVIDSGQSDIYTQEVIYNLLNDPISLELLKIGNRKFGYKDEELPIFLERACNIPYQFGGLGYKIEDLDPAFYAGPVCQNIINILKQNTESSYDRFVKIFHLEDNFITISLNERKGARNFKELRKLMLDLRKLNEPGVITNEFLQDIRKRIQKYLDLQRRLENQGRSASTKNRQTLKYDADKLFRQETKEQKVVIFNYKDDFMSKQLLLDFKNNKDKETMATIFKYNAFMDKIEGEIGLYDGVNDKYWGLKSNEFPGRWIRLETKLDNRYQKNIVTKSEIEASPNHKDYLMIRDLLKKTQLYSLFKEYRDKYIQGFTTEVRQKWLKDEIFKYMTKRKKS